MSGASNGGEGRSTPSTLSDPKAQEVADRLRDLVGRRLDRIEVVPLGVMFHFSAKATDNGVVYWAYGGPK